MVLVRLGHRASRTKLTPTQQEAFERTMNDGFALCRPQGCWLRLGVSEHRETGVLLEGGTMLESVDLARLLRHSRAVAILAATAGPEIVRAAAQAAESGDGATAVTYDAVGGQTAEAAMEWIGDLIRQQLRRGGEQLTPHRFSPGYGDLHLENQREIYRRLQLDKLGIRLTPGFMLMPEKSVTAVAGIEPTKQIEEPNES